MHTFRRAAYIIAFLSPLLGESNLISVAGLKIPAFFNFFLLFTALVLSKRPDYLFLFRVKTVRLAILYIGIIVFNYAFVLNDLFFKVFDDITPLWISLIRRVILAASIFFAFRDDQQAIKVFHFYCAGLLLSAFSAYPEMLIFHHNLITPEAVSNEGYQRALGFFSNPNDFALTIVISGVFVFHQYMYTKNKAFLLIYLLLIPPLLFTYSRNGFACLVLSIFLTVYLGKKINYKRIIYFGFSAVGLAVVMLSIPSIRDRILLLFSGEDSSMAARSVVLLAAAQKWTTMPVFGIGIYSTPLLMVDSGNEGLLLTIHNFYAHALLEGGVVGFLVAIMFLYSLFRLSKSNYVFYKGTESETYYFSRAALISLIVTYCYIFFGNHINFEFLWYLIGVQLVLLRTIKRGNPAKTIMANE